MLSQALRAAKYGSLWTPGVAVIAAVVFAFISGEGLWLRLPVIAAAGAVFGGVVFGIIGLVSSVLFLKPVGWTFVYSFFGAVLLFAAAYFLVPTIGFADTPAPEGASSDIITLAAVPVVGLISGALVAMNLKRAPG